MKNELEIKFGSVIYDKINTVRMSEQERQVAIHAMQDADAIVEAVLWVSHKIEQLGASLFLNHSVKH
jgi:bacterioferritin (cytochrome b1)